MLRKFFGNTKINTSKKFPIKETNKYDHWLANVDAKEIKESLEQNSDQSVDSSEQLRSHLLRRLV